ncbi:MAG: hypothetical protein JWP83_5809 [Mycobacterium sp.]|jgi:hypothetical protein|nr:hypothetical protein [Mycobacterium sp.]
MSDAGGFGEGAHGDEAHPPQAGGRDDWTPPWDPPEAGYPAYSPPGYPPGYPAEYPPPIPPPGYGPPRGYGGPPYPPGTPQYGAPPPGYVPPVYPTGPTGYPGGYHATPDYQVKAGTNGLAIASLVSSFTGFFCCVIGSIVAIVLGVIAMNQIKETRQEGYGLAVTGIVIGVGTLLVFLIIAIFSIRSH